MVEGEAEGLKGMQVAIGLGRVSDGVSRRGRHGSAVGVMPWPSETASSRGRARAPHQRQKARTGTRQSAGLTPYARVSSIKT